jgi:carboxyl-terminal processing protease
MIRKFACTMFISAMLSACGGGDGSPGTCSGSAANCLATASAGGANTYAPYSEPPIPVADTVAQQCETPRPAGTIDPFTQQAYSDVQGSLTNEKLWLRSMVNDTYLWYQDVVPLDPFIFVLGGRAPRTNPSNNSRTMVSLESNFDVVDTYFNSQRSLLLTNSGKPKDQFHFTYLTNDWVALSLAGSSVGFGFQVALIASSPPRSALVAYSEPGSQASANHLTRGARFISVNGVDVATGNADTLNEGLFAPVAGKQYTFQVLDQGSSAPRSIAMTAGTVISTPVQNVHTLPAPYSSVGYIQFNDHMATAESQLIAAVNQLKAANSGAGISDLVLDLRYNGGGLLDIASELAYMIAGSAATTGKAFEKLSFNDKNPFNLSDADKITPFHQVTQGFSVPSGQALPQLGLPRVFVITGSGTCSASESIINGLNGAGISVILIGNTSCGKPYGFYPQDNCGVTYFTVQFKGVNNAGFGDYADGFTPGNTGSPANHLPGCVVADDFSKPLGDSTEARLASALQYRANGICPVTALAAKSVAPGVSAGETLSGGSQMRQNRFLRPKAKL